MPRRDFHRVLSRAADDRMRMRELLTRAEQLNEVAGPNYDYIVALAGPLGIRPIRDEKVAHLSSDDSFCQPLIAG